MLEPSLSLISLNSGSSILILLVTPYSYYLSSLSTFPLITLVMIMLFVSLSLTEL